jgi:hypothetical protein
MTIDLELAQEALEFLAARAANDIKPFSLMPLLVWDTPVMRVPGAPAHRTGDTLFTCDLHLPLASDFASDFCSFVEARVQARGFAS